MKRILLVECGAWLALLSCLGGPTPWPWVILAWVAVLTYKVSRGTTSLRPILHRLTALHALVFLFWLIPLLVGRIPPLPGWRHPASLAAIFVAVTCHALAARRLAAAAEGGQTQRQSAQREDAR